MCVFTGTSKGAKLKIVHTTHNIKCVIFSFSYFGMYLTLEFYKKVKSLNIDYIPLHWQCEIEDDQFGNTF